MEKEVSETHLSLPNSVHENEVIFYPVDPGLPGEQRHVSGSR